MCQQSDSIQIVAHLSLVVGSRLMMQINILLSARQKAKEINLGLISIDDALIEIIPFVRKMWQTGN